MSGSVPRIAVEGMNAGGQEGEVCGRRGAPACGAPGRFYVRSGNAIEDKLKRFTKIRMLYQLGPDISAFTPGAMWDDAKVGIRHVTAFEKIAVVSDVEWIVGAVKVFAFLIPCPVKIFRTEELSDAKDWVSE